MGLIWFEWWNCENGYDVVELKAGFIDAMTSDGGELLAFHKAKGAPYWVSSLLPQYNEPQITPEHFYELLLAAGPKFVVANDTRGAVSSPLESSVLFRELADTKPTPDGVKSFAGKYGLLEGSVLLGSNNLEPNIIEPFSLWISEIKDLKRLVTKWDDAKKKGSIHSFVELFNDHIADIGGGSTAQLAQTSGADHPSLRLVPRTLRSAIWLQFAQAVSENQILGKCEECPTWFEIGPGGGRPEKVYCSNACQMRAYRKRAKAKKERGI